MKKTYYFLFVGGGRIRSFEFVSASLDLALEAAVREKKKSEKMYFRV